jgi:hypothetical protein
MTESLENSKNSGARLRCSSLPPQFFKLASRICEKLEKLPSGTGMEANLLPGAGTFNNLPAFCSEKFSIAEFFIRKL